MTENEVYEFYSLRVKVAYSEVEARCNELPVELLFEIHSAFDHLKRYHLGEDTEERASEKAYSHLKRGVLDAYKLKLKYHNVDYKELFIGNQDLKLIDSGKFLPDALKMHSRIVKCAKEARIGEGNNDNEVAFEKWYETSVLIDEFEDKYFDSEKIVWAKNQGVFQFRANFVVGIVTGVIASAIFSLIMWLI